MRRDLARHARGQFCPRGGSALDGRNGLSQRLGSGSEGHEFRYWVVHHRCRLGSVRVLNRRHEFENFPLMSITIALASNSEFEGLHLAQLDDALTELKTLGKGMQGSVVVSERRRRNASSSHQAAA